MNLDFNILDFLDFSFTNFTNCCRHQLNNELEEVKKVCDDEAKERQSLMGRYIYLDTWIPGYMDIWIPGYLDTMIPGYLDTWWIPGYMDTWKHGY